MNKRAARYERKLKRQAALTSSLVIPGVQNRMTFHEISSHAKHDRSKNYGGKVLWNSSRLGTAALRNNKYVAY